MGNPFRNLSVGILLTLAGFNAQAYIIDDAAKIYNDLNEAYSKDGPIVFKNYFSSQFGQRFGQDFPALLQGFPKLPRAEVKQHRMYFADTLWVGPGYPKKYGEVLVNGRPVIVDIDRGALALRDEINLILATKRVSREGSLWQWFFPEAWAEAHGDLRLAKMSTLGMVGLGAAIGTIGSAIIFALLKKKRPVTYRAEGSTAPHGVTASPVSDTRTEEKTDEKTEETSDDKGNDTEIKGPTEEKVSNPESVAPKANITIDDLTLKNYFCVKNREGLLVPRNHPVFLQAYEEKESGKANIYLGSQGLAHSFIKSLKEIKLTAKEKVEERLAVYLTLIGAVDSKLRTEIEEQLKNPAQFTEASQKKLEQKIAATKALSISSFPSLKENIVEAQMGDAKIKVYYELNASTEGQHPTPPYKITLQNSSGGEALTLCERPKEEKPNPVPTTPKPKLEVTI